VIKIKKNKKLILIGSLLTVVGLFAGVTYAAFTDEGSVLGSSFSVGSADLKLLTDVSLPPDQTNLSEELQGPSFEGIGQNWQEDYLIKIFNNGTSNVNLATSADYETANDPEDLRQEISVEPFEWNDTNSDGILDEGELGTSLGVKTIVKWKTEGFDLGSLDSGSTKELVLRFSTENLSETKQGATGVFDFIFESIEIE
jgi:hypothetical protein